MRNPTKAQLAARKKAGIVFHDKCEGYGCDECCGMGMWDVVDDRLIRTIGAWFVRKRDEDYAQKRGWDRLQEVMHERVDAMQRRLENACDYLRVPKVDDDPPVTRSGPRQRRP